MPQESAAEDGEVAAGAHHAHLSRTRLTKRTRIQAKERLDELRCWAHLVGSETLRAQRERPASLSYMTNERTGAQIPTGSGPMPANTSESISSRPVSEPGFA